MKEPIEYLGNVNSFTTREELYNIGKQMQIEAYNEAIIDSSDNATILMRKKSQFGKSRKWQNVKENEEVDLFSFECMYSVNKNSILKLLKS